MCPELEQSPYIRRKVVNVFISYPVETKATSLAILIGLIAVSNAMNFCYAVQQRRKDDINPLFELLCFPTG